MVTGSCSTRALPSGLAMHQLVGQEPLVVAGGEVGALVGAPRLLAPQPGLQDALGDVEHVGQLERRDQLGVERPAGVQDADPLDPLLQPAERCRRPRPCPGRCGRCRRPPPSSPASRRGWRGRRRRPAACPSAALIRRASSATCAAIAAAGRWRVAAYSAAARPARAPKTRHSGSEFEPEPVGAVDAHAGGLAGGVQPAERGRPVDVGVDAAHHVVHDRPDRDQLGHRVDPLVLQAQLAHERDPGLDQLLAEVAQVEVDDRAVRRVRSCGPSPSRRRTPGRAGPAARAPCCAAPASGVGLPRS